MSDVGNMKHVLPSLDQVLKPEFFGRATLYFRILWRSFDMHLANPVKDEVLSSISSRTNKCDDARLHEHAWFVIFTWRLSDLSYAVLKAVQLNKVP